MKLILCSIIFVLWLSVGVSAQSLETFDAATFVAPKGWQKKAGTDSIQFSTSDEENYCLITLYRSVPGLDDSKKNFDAAWESLVKEAVNVASRPQMAEPSSEGGWKIQTGYSPFEKNGTNGIAMLVTASGFGSMMNATVLTNTQNYEASIGAFLGSIKLKKPTAAPDTNAVTAQNNAAIIGEWGMTSSDQRSPANGGGGYIKRQYNFNADGTYMFMIKTFAYTSSQLLFTKETGTYNLTGNKLRISPQKGFIQAWTKATVISGDGKPAQTDDWGKLVKTQPTKLETVTYEISKEYFSGIDEWNLIMRTGATTEREGPFVSSSAFPNSYFYKTQKFPIEPPK